MRAGGRSATPPLAVGATGTATWPAVVQCAVQRGGSAFVHTYRKVGVFTAPCRRDRLQPSAALRGGPATPPSNPPSQVPGRDRDRTRLTRARVPRRANSRRLRAASSAMDAVRRACEILPAARYRMARRPTALSIARPRLPDDATASHVLALLQLRRNPGQLVLNVGEAGMQRVERGQMRRRRAAQIAADHGEKVQVSLGMPLENQCCEARSLPGALWPRVGRHLGALQPMDTERIGAQDSGQQRSVPARRIPSEPAAPCTRLRRSWPRSAQRRARSRRGPARRFAAPARPAASIAPARASRAARAQRDGSPGSTSRRRRRPPAGCHRARPAAPPAAAPGRRPA